MPLLEGELSAALLGTATGDRSLMEGSVRMVDGAAVGVVIASEGYPDEPVTGRIIEGAEPSIAADDGAVLCFHAATRRRADGAFETTGGRVVTLVGRGPTLDRAREAAYAAASEVRLDGAVLRTDVAALHVGDRQELGDQAG
jgi:phosphoribosylamine---glycine ligase